MKQAGASILNLAFPDDHDAVGILRAAANDETSGTNDSAIFCDRRSPVEHQLAIDEHGLYTVVGTQRVASEHDQVRVFTFGDAANAVSHPENPRGIESDCPQGLVRFHSDSYRRGGLQEEVLPLGIGRTVEYHRDAGAMHPQDGLLLEPALDGGTLQISPRQLAGLKRPGENHRHLHPGKPGRKLLGLGPPLDHHLDARLAGKLEDMIDVPRLIGPHAEMIAAGYNRVEARRDGIVGRPGGSSSQVTGK